MTALEELAGLVRKIVIKTDYNYEAARTMWNRAIKKYPLAIAYCQSIEEVQQSIKWAEKYQVPVRIRSGGHHYEGYSTGNDVLVIDVSLMNRIHLDEDSQTVTIEGGVRNRELYEAVCGRGYPFPGGGCPTVGVAGFALGGGWGYSGRFLGLGCDAITEVKLVDARGEIITASQNENPELFWALKGSGGGQFGVVVSMTFKLPEKREEEAILIRLELSEVSRAQQLQMWTYWQENIRKMPAEANFKLSFYNSEEKGTGILLIGIFYGGKEEAHEVLAPFIKIGHKMHLRMEPMSVLEVNRWIQNAHPDYEHYKSSGRFMQELLGEAEMNELLDGIEERAQGAIYTALSCYGMGGKMLEVPDSTAAFAYRNSLYILGFQSVWEDNQYKEANHNWFDLRFELIKKYTKGAFVNFPNGELKDYRTEYFGAGSMKLQEIREKVDPETLFKFEQSL